MRDKHFSKKTGSALLKTPLKGP